MEEIGQRLTEVLLEIRHNPKSIQSDFVRTHAAHVAAAASIGFITTKTLDGGFSRFWRITKEGLLFLEIHQ